MEGLSINGQLQNKYNNYYGGESEWRRIGALDKVNNIVTICNDYSHGSILEIGAGEGSILKQLSEQGFGEELFALEISKTAVKVINQRRIRSLIGCALFDGYNIPFKNNDIDLVILCHVIEHLEYPRKLLYETFRVAEYVFIEVSLEETLRMPKDFKKTSVGHINFYSPKSIRRLVQTCGSKVLKQITTNPSLRAYQFRYGSKGALKYLIKEIGLRFFPFLAPRIWSYHSALICKKLN